LPGAPAWNGRASRSSRPAGFNVELRAEAGTRADVVLIDLERLYADD